MSAKSTGLGILALFLLNPLVMLCVLGAGIFLFILAATTIIVYGLETALLLLIIFGVVLLALHTFKIVDVQKHPYWALLPLLGFISGYGLQRMRLFSFASPSPDLTNAQLTVSAQAVLTFQIVSVSVIIAIVIALAIHLAKRR